MKYSAKFSIFMILLTIIAGCATMGPSYNQEISQIKSVPQLSVVVSYIGGVFWQAKIANNSDATVKLIWDESAYVNSKGKSTRLIRGQTRKLHSAQAQPSSPIPPGALLVESFTGEALAQFAGSYIIPKPENPSAKGRMYLSFEIDGNKYTWEGSVAFIQVSQ